MILRVLPLIVGLLASGLLVLNRLLSANPSPEQTRSDALGLLMGAVLVLVAILAGQAQPRTPETVEIDAPLGINVTTTNADLEAELRWLGQTLIAQTATVSVVVWSGGETLLRMGYLGAGDFQLGPIVERVLKTQKPVYLVTLRLFPGRVEFVYLPEAMQAIVCQPLGNQGVLVLGANQSRSYNPQDLQWIEALSQRLTQRLS